MKTRVCGKCGAKIKIEGKKVVIEQKGLKPLCDECIEWIREVTKSE